MITGTITFLIIFAVIGSIIYGQRLVKTEKSDAVFGNPERAKGGIHWVVVGTCFLLFTWLYYSWDIAKAFYPKSANELCQVAKVNESLLSLKYLFPIEERSHKSTALIKRENINISNKIIEIQNSSELKNQDKVTQYKSGKVKLFGYFVGEVMKASKGKANPNLVNDILKTKLK